MLFWVEQGVRIFRVDNPHTKPLPFWEWLIEDIRARDPDVIFLSEAFTRPTMMYRLAKIGFSQSYTYFTWRNTKHELTSYFTELADEPVADFFRPHLFVNTPDINPFFLQTGGRPAFLIRAALACTLSGLWGMYNGFELCEAGALPGREEYLDSEKYEIRAGTGTAPATSWPRSRGSTGSAATIRRCTAIAASSSSTLSTMRCSTMQGALPTGAIRFWSPSTSIPSRAIETDIEIPLWRFGLPDEAAIGAEDLMRAQSLTFHGKRQRVRLDPDDLPFAIWRLDNPAGRRYGQTS